MNQKYQMKQAKKYLLLCLIYILSGVSLFAQTLRVGIYQDKPLVFMEKGGRARGIAVEILENIAAQEKWSLECVRGTLDECLTGLSDGKIDLIAGLSYSEERGEKYDFTEETLLTSWGEIYSKPKSRYQSFFDMNNKTIAVLRGDIYYHEFLRLIENFRIQCHFIETTDYQKVFEMISTGEADAGIVSRLHDPEYVKKYRLERTPIVFCPVEIRYAGTKGKHTDTLKRIDQHLNQFKRDSRSLYYQSVQAWLDFVPHHGFPRWLKQLLFTLGIALFIFIITSIILRREVKSKTLELRKKYQELQREIAERKTAEDALSTRDEQFRRAITQADAVAYQRDYETEQFIFIGEGIQALTGYHPAELTHQVWKSLIQECVMRGEGAGFTLEEAVKRTREGELKEWRADYRILTRDGQERWLADSAIQILNENGIPVASLGILQDITERKRAEEQLLHDAFYDALTGLPNRALFLDRLKLLIGHSRRREEYLFAILFLDLDRFKNVNDSLGHIVGDQLLVEVAHRLEGCVRPGDSVSRLGGDEFIIILDDISDVSDATRVAERIQKKLSIPMKLDGQEVYTSASIGIALSATGYEKADDMLRDADTAMYRAKDKGRACHVVFDAQMHDRAVNLLTLESDLRHAVEHNEFTYFYQPIVSLENGRTAGFEVLLRWEHPKRGIINPDEFVEMCEDTGLIVPIFEKTLKESCRRLCDWQKRFPSPSPLSISVNLSARQFTQNEWVDQIEQTLKQNNLKGKYLNLEITESVFMKGDEQTQTLLRKLEQLDVQLHIDDFGTGYSSLSYLHRLPIDAFKIDSSFVSRMDMEQINLEIIRTILALAYNLGHTVTAEGVENGEQFVQLRALKCHYGQGNYFAQPMRASDIDGFLNETPRWQMYFKRDRD
ncbi:EAL domain-containing protein [Candidatus Sumerlaeota bacterium]|nr:EAL domain-containing protein [Candidatus Sumerlaeota bacterium]